MIFVNITNSFLTRAHTGIQRVVKQLSKRLFFQGQYSFLVFIKDRFYKIDEEEFYLYLDNKEFTPKKIFNFCSFVSGDLFVDLDASWGDCYDVDYLYRYLKNNNILIAKLHYDAVPILYPNFSHQNTVYRYVENFSTAIRYADLWLCISKTVERDLQAICRNFGLPRLNTRVIELGSDIKISNDNVKHYSDEYDFLNEKKFILSVGTVEPRKNYDLVLDVFDEYRSLSASNEDVHLVIVGKSGWNNNSITRRILEHPKFNKNLHWFQKASDKDLAALYNKARVCLCLSHYEGYGLPVVEALAHGTPVICTAHGAMEEAAKGFANCVSLDVSEVVSRMSLYLKSPSPVRIENYAQTTWDKSANELIKIISDINKNDDFHFLPSQAVYISIRPNSIRRSIKSILLNMSFIRQIVVLTSDLMYEEMFNVAEEIGFDIKIIKESELFINDLPKDHQERNTFLRYNLYRQDFIDPNFIAFDDDCVVVNPVCLSDFIEGGKHKAYYFYEDGLSWLGAFPKPTSFDSGLWRTVKFLHNSGYDVKLYNSHQPQIINKNLANELLGKSKELNLDEWSFYFNSAKHMKPNSFLDVPYRAAGWPANFESWLPSCVPENICFFNDLSFNDDLNENFISYEIDKWLNALKAAMDYDRTKILPKNPCLNISHDDMFFNPGNIECSQGARFFIPIISSIYIDEINYNFLGRKVVFSREEVPNFMYIKLPIEESIKDFEIEVEVSAAQWGANKRVIAFVKVRS